MYCDKKNNSCYSHLIELPEKSLSIAKKNDFDIKAYSFDAKREDLRKPRIVRVGFKIFKLLG